MLAVKKLEAENGFVALFQLPQGLGVSSVESIYLTSALPLPYYNHRGRVPCVIIEVIQRRLGKMRGK